ncbi:uncharacterized protein [Spinacia oleracea]|uniref:Retrovirus-related Pol polyprotein from transposon TNT 1-94 n=1 Tax=Spinacia oleracea TaxID=3562 RepID=A0ABM3QZ19_SPIOL|nr:uncharacterized protein LOC130463503 [Spinacia oleracea]
MNLVDFDERLVWLGLELMKMVEIGGFEELFKLHCRVHRVIDHIIAPAPSAAGDSTTAKTEAEIAEWNRLDAAVLQWIYGTISHDLLSTIIVPDTTAMKAWKSLRLIFQDNEISRAVYLEQQFNAVKLDNFPNMDSYCLELKTLADQLAGVGAPVSNNRLVLRLIAGLNANYDGMAINLSRAKPLPSFTEARSSLCMEEKRKAHQAGDGATVDATALLTTNHHDDSDGAPNNFNRSNQPRRGGNNGNRGHNGGKRGGRGKHRGGNNGGNSSGAQTGGGQQQAPQSWGSWQWVPHVPQQQQNWQVPPCPYPHAAST